MPSIPVIDPWGRCDLSYEISIAKPQSDEARRKIQLLDYASPITSLLAHSE
jgi:hypothetical protein